MANKKEKKSGCGTYFVTVIFVIIVFTLFNSINEDGNKTNQPTYTARPKATATAKYIEPSKIKKAIEDTLANLKLFDYCNVSCDETAVSIYVGINNIAEELSALKAIGENENNKDWVTIKDNLMKIYNQIVGTMSQYGYTKEKCAFYLVNTKNPDNFLLMIHGGAITYDCMK